jgi:hypothetical protein
MRRIQSYFCPNFAVSATRMMVMDERHLHSDPCDRRLIRFNNCMQLMSCICTVASIFYKELRHCAHLLRCASHCVYCSVQAYVCPLVICVCFSEACLLGVLG